MEALTKGPKNLQVCQLYHLLLNNSWKYGRTLKLHDKRVVQYHKSSIKPLGGLFISSVLTGGLIERESLLFDREAYLI